MNIKDIKSQYPYPLACHYAFGEKDLDNIRALISEVERLTVELSDARQSLYKVAEQRNNILEV